MAFPKDFLWGTATASAQIEGGWDEDGRTPSIWDAAPAGKIKTGANCRSACDHYHRWKEDIALMKSLGVKSYRLSVSWSRVLPADGKISQKGIGFYKNIVRELRENDIEPIVTIFHWDLPVWVEKKGGWFSEEIVRLFAEYTRVVVDALSDLVKYWIPLNEPQCFIMNGHMAGTHAPFRRRVFALPRLTRNCLMAFRASADVIRDAAKTEPKIGISMYTGAFIPKSESGESVAEAQHKTFYYQSGLMINRWWGDPLIKGEPVRAYGFFSVSEKDIPKIKTKLDFIGLNVYAPFRENWFKTKEKLPAERKNSLGWVNDGRGLYWAIRFWSERYGLPVMITENGMCDNDAVTDDGHIHDEKRIGFIEDYLSGLRRAVDEGYPVLGYQYWSMMDNFEWAEGYTPRFGLIHVDYETFKRTPKDSAFFYKKIIETNGECLQSQST